MGKQHIPRRTLPRQKQNGHIEIEEVREVLDQHKLFLDFCRKRGSFTSHKINQAVDSTPDSTGVSVKIPEYNQLSVLGPAIQLHPEFVAYTFSLEGCPRKLLWFLILCKVDRETGEFGFNDQTVEHFKEYCSIFKSEPYENKVIKKALRKLVEMNITLSFSRTFYMINPLLFSATSQKRNLVNTYSNHLLEKGKDIITDFLPKTKK